jgi:hypothetical protein
VSKPSASAKTKPLLVPFTVPAGFTPVHTLIVGLDAKGQTFVQAENMAAGLALHMAVACISAIVVRTVSQELTQAVQPPDGAPPWPTHISGGQA